MLDLILVAILLTALGGCSLCIYALKSRVDELYEAVNIAQKALIENNRSQLQLHKLVLDDKATNLSDEIRANLKKKMAAYEQS